LISLNDECDSNDEEEEEEEEEDEYKLSYLRYPESSTLDNNQEE
jgi:hypothetical protein